MHNLTIRDCLFSNNTLTCIDIVIYQGMKECTSYDNRNILIEGNTFKHPARSCIRNHDFGDHVPNAPSYNPMVLIDHCKNVTLDNNQNLFDGDVVQQDSNPDASPATN